MSEPKPNVDVDSKEEESHSSVVKVQESDIAEVSSFLASSGEMEEVTADVVSANDQTILGTSQGLQAAIEAILFTAPEPLTVRRLCNALDINDSRLVQAAIERLRDACDQSGRGVQVVETTEGYQLSTREEFADFILRLRGRKRRPPLSPAALETLAIIAYRQPLIRAEVEAIRGVESSGTLRNLMDLGLVEIVGTREVLGRPRMYGTTQMFLDSYGLKGLAELPPISELKRALRDAQTTDPTSTPASRNEPTQPNTPMEDALMSPATQISGSTLLESTNVLSNEEISAEITDVLPASSIETEKTDIFGNNEEEITRESLAKLPADDDDDDDLEDDEDADDDDTDDDEDADDDDEDDLEEDDDEADEDADDEDDEDDDEDTDDDDEDDEDEDEDAEEDEDEPGRGR